MVSGIGIVGEAGGGVSPPPAAIRAPAARPGLIRPAGDDGPGLRWQDVVAFAACGVLLWSMLIKAALVLGEVLPWPL